MDILSYLATLIQTNNEVGVPGLGTFVKKKSPGRYDAGLHAFLPPSYQLAFQLEVTETALLAEYVGEQHNLSEASAVYHIDQFVLKIKQELDEHLEADVSPLGRLMLSGRLITFLPNDQLSLGHQFFGLPTVAEAIATPVVEETAVPVVEEQPTTVDEERVEWVDDEHAVLSVEEKPAAADDVVSDNTELTPVAETEEQPEIPASADDTDDIPAADAETLEAIVIENSIEEENPGQLPAEPIYMAEPAELTQETADVNEDITVTEEIAPFVEEPVATEPPVTTEEPVTTAVREETPELNEETTITEASVAAVTPVEETPLVVVPPVFERPVVEESRVQHTPEAVVPPVSGAATLPEERVNYQIEEQPIPGTPGYYKVLIIVLFLLCLAFALYMLGPNWFSKSNKVTSEPEPTTVPVADKPAAILPDTLEKKPDTLKQDAALVDTTPVTVPPVTKKTVVANTVVAKTVPAKPAKPAVTTFEVIASSVYGEKAAQQFIASMKSKWGINAKIVSQLPGKKIKISVATFKDEKTARLERARLEEKLNIPGLYIYTNTNKPD